MTSLYRRVMLTAAVTRYQRIFYCEMMSMRQHMRPSVSNCAAPVITVTFDLFELKIGTPRLLSSGERLEILVFLFFKPPGERDSSGWPSVLLLISNFSEFRSFNGKKIVNLWEQLR